MKKQDLYYTAGIIDGEGSVLLSRIHTGKTRSPVISVSSTTYDILLYLKETFGGSISKHKVYKEHHKQSWSWKICYNKALEFCNDIYPYLKEPIKRKRAKLITEKYKDCTPRNGKYTNNLIKLKEEFEQQFFDIVE